MKISELKSSRPAHVRLIPLLESLAEDEVLTNSELQERFQINTLNGNILRHKEKFIDHCQVVSMGGAKIKVWGSKKAIAALREQISENF